MPRPIKSVTLQELTFSNDKVAASGHVVRKVIYDGKVGFFKPCYTDLSYEPSDIQLGKACIGAHKLDDTYPPFIAKLVVATSVYMRNGAGKVFYESKKKKCESNRVAEQFLVFDESGTRIIGTLSIGLPDFEEMASYGSKLPSQKTDEDYQKLKRLVPDVERLIKINIALTLVLMWLNGEDDGHPGNVDVWARLFDLDLCNADIVLLIKIIANRAVPNEYLQAEEIDKFPRYNATHAPAKTLPANYNLLKRFLSFKAFRALEKNDVFRAQIFQAMVSQVLAHDEDLLRVQLKEYLGEQQVGLSDSFCLERDKKSKVVGVKECHRFIVPKQSDDGNDEVKLGIYLSKKKPTMLLVGTPVDTDAYFLLEEREPGEEIYIDKACIRVFEPGGVVELEENAPLNFLSTDVTELQISSSKTDAVRDKFAALNPEGSFIDFFLAYKSRRMDRFRTTLVNYVDMSEHANKRKFQTLGGFFDVYSKTFDTIKSNYVAQGRPTLEELEAKFPGEVGTRLSELLEAEKLKPPSIISEDELRATAIEQVKEQYFAAMQEKFLMLLRDSHRMHFSEQIKSLDLAKIQIALEQDMQQPFVRQASSDVEQEESVPASSQLLKQIAAERDRLQQLFQDYYSNDDQQLQRNQDFVANSLISIKTLRALELPSLSSKIVAPFCDKYEEFIQGVNFCRQDSMPRVASSHYFSYQSVEQDESEQAPRLELAVDDLANALVWWLGSKDICESGKPDPKNKKQLADFEHSRQARREVVQQAAREAFERYNTRSLLNGYGWGKTMGKQQFNNIVETDDPPGLMVTQLIHKGRWTSTSFNPPFVQKLTASMMEEFSSDVSIQFKFKELFSVSQWVERGDYKWNDQVGNKVVSILQTAFMKDVTLVPEM